jgi:hypothetical protein
VCISIETTDISYRVEHGFATLPETATLVGLRDEAIRTFDALYPEHAVDAQLVYVRRLTPDERTPDDREHSEKT